MNLLHLIPAVLLLVPAAQAAPEAACPAGTVLLAGGSYPMGETGLRVTVAAFCIELTEVTVAAYSACVRAGSCSPASGTEGFRGPGQPAQGAEPHLCNGDKPDRPNHPLNCVTWIEAGAYCAWRGMRLPTEEEWEWAARGGERATLYPWGNAEPSDQLCWKHRDGERRLGTCPVAAHPSGDSPKGVKDLSGNVWEWTASRDSLEGGVACRVRRGGGWSSNSSSRVTATVRFCDPPEQRQTDIGFRCARSR